MKNNNKGRFGPEADHRNQERADRAGGEEYALEKGDSGSERSYAQNHPNLGRGIIGQRQARHESKNKRKKDYVKCNRTEADRLYPSPGSRDCGRGANRDRRNESHDPDIEQRPRWVTDRQAVQQSEHQPNHRRAERGHPESICPKCKLVIPVATLQLGIAESQQHRVKRSGGADGRRSGWWIPAIIKLAEPLELLHSHSFTISGSAQVLSKQDLCQLRYPNTRPRRRIAA